MTIIGAVAAAVHGVVRAGLDAEAPVELAAARAVIDRAGELLDASGPAIRTIPRLASRGTEHRARRSTPARTSLSGP